MQEARNKGGIEWVDSQFNACAGNGLLPNKGIRTIVKQQAMSEKNNVIQTNVVYIIVWTDGTIESVWTDLARAKEALKSHAKEGGMPEDYYRIVERKVNQLHAISRD